MEKSIDDLLNDEEPEVTEQTEAETPPEVNDNHVRDEKGRFAAKGVEEGAPPAPDKLPQEEYKALKAEREKRQSLETRLAEMQSQLERMQNPPAPAPDMFEAPEDWQQHFGGQVVTTAVQQATLNAKLDMSEMMMRQQQPDFEEMKEAFLTLMSENPQLQQQALSDPHPWNKAYQIAKNHRTMQDLGATSIDDLKAKLLEQLKQEQQSAPSAPVSLTNERNVGSRSGPAWSGPKPLSELLG
jgi:hypothetical protein